MSTSRRQWRPIGIGLLLALLALIALIIFRQRLIVPQTGQTDTVVIDLSAQLPTGDSPLPTVIISGTIWPTATPIPTFAPPPIPTLIPGPTVTPIPLPLPAPDASGTILYVEIIKQDNLAIYSLPVTKEGDIQAPSEFITDVPGWEMYSSPDGNRIITEDGWGIHYLVHTDFRKPELLFRETLEPRGLFFEWHPDSHHVLMRADDNYTDVGLWLVDTNNEQHVSLLNQFPSPRIAGAAVSPDGMKVVYSPSADFFSSYELWVANINGSEHKQIYESNAMISTLSWSPNNTKIAFIGDGLMLINPDGSEPHTIATNIVSGHGFKPVWSPDAHFIAYVGYEISKNTDLTTNKSRSSEDQRLQTFANTNIYLVDVANGEGRLLIGDGTTTYIDPTWSPDGKFIAIAAYSDNVSEVRRINVDGSNMQKLISSSQPIRFLSWHKVFAIEQAK